MSWFNAAGRGAIAAMASAATLIPAAHPAAADPSATPASSSQITGTTGQCGVADTTSGISIGSDGNLTATVSPGSTGRAARFQFIGTSNGTLDSWTEYKYRYTVSGLTFGPQSNEVVRFGPDRNDPDAAATNTFNSPDDHNSNIGAAGVQSLYSTIYTAQGNTEIWVKAIFDVPSVSDPSCWTNAYNPK